MAACAELSTGVSEVIRTDRTALLQAWYQSLYGVTARNEAQVEQVMKTTEAIQTEAVKGPASDNSKQIDVYA